MILIRLAQYSDFFGVLHTASCEIDGYHWLLCVVAKRLGKKAPAAHHHLQQCVQTPKKKTCDQKNSLLPSGAKGCEKPPQTSNAARFGFSGSNLHHEP